MHFYYVLLAGFHGRVSQSLASLACVLKRPAGNTDGDGNQPEATVAWPPRSARDALLARRPRHPGPLCRKWVRMSANVHEMANLPLICTSMPQRGYFGEPGVTPSRQLRVFLILQAKRLCLQPRRHFQRLGRPRVPDLRQLAEWAQHDEKLP